MKKLLLDENLPKKLKYRFGDGYEVMTVPELDWASLQNGELLQVMQEAGLNCLITADKKLRHQQNNAKFGVTLIVLNTPDNRYETVLPFVTKIRTVLESLAVGDYHWIDP